MHAEALSVFCCSFGSGLLILAWVTVYLVCPPHVQNAAASMGLVANATLVLVVYFLPKVGWLKHNEG